MDPRYKCVSKQPAPVETNGGIGQNDGVYSKEKQKKSNLYKVNYYSCDCN